MAEYDDLNTEDTDIDTGWENPPKLSELKQNLTDAQVEHATQISKVKTWLDHLYIRGAVKMAPSTTRSTVQPKTIRKQAEWKYPSLSEPFLSAENLFKVSPQTRDDRERAYQNGLILNNQFNTQIDKVRFIDDYVRSAVDEGTVIVRVGWQTEEEEVEEEIPTYEFIPDMSGTALQQYTALIALKQSNPAEYEKYSNPGIEKALEILFTQGQVVIPQQTGTTVETKTVETVNKPTLDVCDLENIVLDPTCQGNLEKANFIIFSFETSKAELIKAGRYFNIEKIVQGSESPLAHPDYKEGEDNTSFEFKDDARVKFVAREYWGFWDIHKTGRTVPIVATWVGSTLIRMEESPFPDKKLPFVAAQLLPVRRSSYGEPDCELLIDNQKIIGAVTRGMIDLMGKAAAGQTGMRKDFLDIGNARKYKNGLDYEFNGNVDPRLGVFQHNYPEIPQSAYNMISMQNNEAESFSGVKAFSSGINSAALGDVATGIKGVLDAAAKRELTILRRLAAGIIAIGRKIISLNAVFLSDEEIVRISEEEYTSVRRDDLAGNFDLKLTITTAEEDDMKAKELAFMLQTMGNNMDPELSRMILSDIAVLRKMPDLAKSIREYEPKPDPMLQKKQELELALLEAQAQKEASIAQDNAASAGLTQIEAMLKQAEIALTQAKTATEQAKARHLMSGSDLQDLDYVEQEAGVKQERDLQKMREQSKAQAQTKIIEAALKEQTQPAKA